MARGRVRTHDDDDVAQHGAHTGQLMHCIHLCNVILEIVNWLLSNQGKRWPVPHDHIAGSGWNLSRSSVFLKLTADQVMGFHWIAGQVFPKLLESAKQPVLCF